MRHLFTLLVAGLTVVVMSAAQAAADSVVVKGPHICCGNCVTAAQKLLANIDGVSDAKADVKSKTVSFTAKDAAATKAGIDALVKGGFSGTATSDGKAVTVVLPEVKKGDKVDAVVVKDVHVCCGLCQKAINKLFADSKVKYEGSGAQRTVRIEGGELYRGTVLETLRKAGFNGTPE
jgi:copper chaperone CopZ